MDSLWKVVGIGVLALVLWIPLARVDGLVDERRMRGLEAREAIARRWGQPQLLGGPVLRMSVPVVVEDERGRRMRPMDRMVLPTELEITARLQIERRYYGIFEHPVYLADVVVSGTFPAVDQAGAGSVRLLVPVRDLRGVRSAGSLEWGRQSLALSSDPFDGSRLSALRADLPSTPEGAVSFRLELRLAGIGEIGFLPLADRTRVQVGAPWGDPGFSGAYLPDQRQIDPDGFSAAWQVLALNRDFGQVWDLADGWGALLEASAFGVELVQPVDLYQRTERTIKYGALFIALTFLGYFVYEVLAGVRLHPVQYGFIGLSMACFYLLLLALSEHLGFTLAYGLAATALCLLCGSYSAAVLGSGRRGLTAGGLFAAIYALLYGLVVGEDYSLLVGSLVLFAMLALAMLLTRRIDWYRMPLPD